MKILVTRLTQESIKETELILNKFKSPTRLFPTFENLKSITLDEDNPIEVKTFYDILTRIELLDWPSGDGTFDMVELEISEFQLNKLINNIHTNLSTSEYIIGTNLCKGNSPFLYSLIKWGYWSKNDHVSWSCEDLYCNYSQLQIPTYDMCLEISIVKTDLDTGNNESIGATVKKEILVNYISKNNIKWCRDGDYEVLPFYELLRSLKINPIIKEYWSEFSATENSLSLIFGYVWAHLVCSNQESISANIKPLNEVYTETIELDHDYENISMSDLCINLEID